MPARKGRRAEASSGGKRARSRIRQTEVPSCSLEQALRVPRAIADQYASEPSTPLMVAKALDMQPKSGPFRTLCAAAAAYGFVEGGAYADKIAISPAGRRIIRPLKEGDDVLARRESFLQPRVIGEFVRTYNHSPVPRDEIAHNVLEAMGVPRDRTAEVFTLIIEGAREQGLVQEIKGHPYIEIPDETRGGEGSEAVPEEDVDQGEAEEAAARMAAGRESREEPGGLAKSAALRRVFVTHGKNKALVEPIKKLLGYGEMVAVVSVEKQSVSKPVPDKVMDEMRTCGAAVIHVDAEQTLIDKDAKEHRVISANVLIEIGAAMALFGRRFILLVREGIELPSNLQGLYEVRYQGDALDGDATIRLLEAINDMKNYPIPEIHGASETES